MAIPCRQLSPSKHTQTNKNVVFARVNHFGGKNYRMNLFGIAVRQSHNFSRYLTIRDEDLSAFTSR